jgi:hypothetical protein
MSSQSALIWAKKAVGGGDIRFILDDEREYRPRSIKLYDSVVNSVIPAPLVKL